MSPGCNLLIDATLNYLLTKFDCKVKLQCCAPIDVFSPDSRPPQDPRPNAPGCIFYYRWPCPFAIDNLGYFHDFSSTFC